jgi:hypothetical protein
MNFLEKDLEQIIYETPNEELRKRGLLIYGKKKRQLRIGKYGICDLITFSTGDYNEYNPTSYNEETKDYIFSCQNVKYLDIDIFEFKKDKVGISAFLQAIGYAKGVERYLNRRMSNEFKINVTLIGRRVDLDSTFVYLTDIISSENFNLRLYTYDYDVNGLNFKKHSGYKLNDEGFGYED